MRHIYVSNCVVLTESWLLVICSVQLIWLSRHMKNGTGSPGHRVTGSKEVSQFHLCSECWTTTHLPRKRANVKWAVVVHSLSRIASREYRNLIWKISFRRKPLKPRHGSPTRHSRSVNQQMYRLLPVPQRRPRTAWYTRNAIDRHNDWWCHYYDAVKS